MTELIDGMAWAKAGFRGGRCVWAASSESESECLKQGRQEETAAWKESDQENCMFAMLAARRQTVPKGVA